MSDQKNKSCAVNPHTGYCELCLCHTEQTEDGEWFCIAAHHDQLESQRYDEDDPSRYDEGDSKELNFN